MRQIVTHLGNVTGPTNLDNQIDVFALDEPGDGGACHEYGIEVRDVGGNCALRVELAEAKKRAEKV